MAAMFAFFVFGFGALFGAFFGSTASSSGASQPPTAEDRLVRSELRNAAVAEEVFMTDNMRYTTNVAELVANGYVADQQVRLTIEWVDANGFCLRARGTTARSEYFYDSTQGGVTKESCSRAVQPAKTAPASALHRS